MESFESPQSMRLRMGHDLSVSVMSCPPGAMSGRFPS